jgi:hypothetical protein
MDDDWFFYHADLTEHTIVFGSHYDFVTYVNLLRWKSMERRNDNG